MIDGLPDREVTTRHGVAVRIRPCRESDAADLYAMDRANILDGRGVVQTLEDLVEPGRYADRMVSRLADVASWLVAERDGRVIAGGSIHRLNVGLCRHVGMFDIAVHPDAQGLGVSRVLAEALVASAAQAGVERLQLFVRSDNHRAIGLYASLGFTRESVRVGFVKLPDGTLIDDDAMVKWLS
ncbi:MAG: GNAT family N-acetyltransferase [Myxococcota bacterium]